MRPDVEPDEHRKIFAASRFRRAAHVVILCLRMNKMMTLVFLSSALTLSSGCGLLVTSFEGEVAVDFEVNAEGNEYAETVTINPTDNDDVRDNQDRIKSGEIQSIVFSVEGVGAENRAAAGSGEVYARLVGDAWGPMTRENAVATFDDTPVEVGSEVTLSVTAAMLERVSGLVFPEGGPREVEAMIVGHTDEGPLVFSGRLTFRLLIEAGL
jgi:hypothetical protein